MAGFIGGVATNEHLCQPQEFEWANSAEDGHIGGIPNRILPSPAKPVSPSIRHLDIQK
ncbi:hypothetical protein CT19431_40411 [Cupriavidus taiwanensis]|nr:hypothetical protein CT19431_40411 [Cupriavidus taiwanensis]